MDEPGTLGHWMKRLRAELDLTQEALAEQAGCAPQTVRAIESGARQPSRALAERLAGVLQVPREQHPQFVRLARTPGDSAPRRQARPDQANPLLATKLYVPRPRPNLVPRPRLIARLDTGLAGPLTLISAPAGFGKTTLLADWLSRQSRPVAWLSLEEQDSDPVRFLRYLIAALQTLAPSIGEAALALLEQPGPASVEPLLTLLLNDLTRLPRPSLLVLDDYHVLQGLPLHQQIAFLAEHLPPLLHLVISTREDPPFPLARFRARGQLCELRAADLRLTRDEAAAFLNGVMGLSLSAADVTMLETRTEGWLAGLQLAALSMQDQADVSGSIAALTGSNRYILDYLIEEVLGRQPSAVQSFLLGTSILDRLCGPLCDALLEGESERMHGGSPSSLQLAVSASQTMLEQLERANLFVISLDAERRWYRYHHLFADLLRARLRATQPECLPGLHSRASLWFEQEGMAAEAIDHALAAAEFERAAGLIEQNGAALAFRGLEQTVLGWFDVLPDEIFRARPTLSNLHAFVLTGMNRLDAAEARLQDAERSVQPDTPAAQARRILGDVAGNRASLVRERGDLERSVALGWQALELLPDRPPGPLLATAHAFLVSGDVTPAVERQVRGVIEEIAGTLRAQGSRSTLVRSITLLARMRVLQGRLREAAAIYDEAAEVAPGQEGLESLQSGATYFFGLGELLVEWNDLEAAERHLSQGLKLVRGPWTIGAYEVTLGYLALARLQRARGESAAALATLAALAALARARKFAPLLLARGAAAQARLALALGNLQAATRWAQASGLHHDDDLSYPREAEHLTLARVLIAQGHGDPAGHSLRDALGLLERLLAAAEAGARRGSAIEILVLQALALQAHGDTTEAVNVLARALSLAAPEGYVRIFLDEGAPMVTLLREVRAQGSAPDYVASLLDATRETENGAAGAGDLGVERSIRGHLDGPGSSGLTEPLSPREIEVLQLIVAGKSNQEIAETLVVALSTVKRHISNIYGKMDVASRTQAVARARALDLV